MYTLLSTCFLHNLCVLNSNLSDNILYLLTFDPFKLAKHKMATKMLRKLHISHGLSHRLVSARFLIDDFALVSLEKNDL